MNQPTRRTFFTALAAVLSFLGIRKAYGLTIRPTSFKARDGQKYTPEKYPYDPPPKLAGTRPSPQEICDEFTAALHRALDIRRGEIVPEREYRHPVIDLQSGFDLEMGAWEFRNLMLAQWNERYIVEGSKSLANLIHQHAREYKASTGSEPTLRTRVGSLPGGVDGAANAQRNGLAVRLVSIWDGDRDEWIYRFDVYYGFES